MKKDFLRKFIGYLAENETKYAGSERRKKISFTQFAWFCRNCFKLEVRKLQKGSFSVKRRMILVFI